MIYGQPVEFVSKFSYLGTMLNSHGNWEAAWDHASQKAVFAYHNAVMGGVFFRAGSFSAMLDFARAKIWPHFNSIMAITGVGDLKLDVVPRDGSDEVSAAAVSESSQ